jgi:hypothetical protein
MWEGWEGKRATYDHETVAARRAGHAEGAELRALDAQGARGAAEGEGNQFRGHCGGRTAGGWASWRW